LGDCNELRFEGRIVITERLYYTSEGGILKLKLGMAAVVASNRDAVTSSTAA
jgi:hypothetical protein